MGGLVGGDVLNGPVRLLGLDPGLRHTGWGVIEVAGNRLTHIADGAVHSDDACPLAERLCQLHAALSEVLERYRPDEAAVEETFVNMNAASTLKLGQARAVSLLVPAQAGLAVAEYPNNMVKKAVVGAGRADKAQVQMMVRMLLPGCAIATADAADALAVAICHAHHRATWRMWQGQGARGARRGTPVAPGPAKQRAVPGEADPAGAVRQDPADGEKRLWQSLRAERIGTAFRRQEPILGFIVDFVAHRERLVVQLDGGQRAGQAGFDDRRTRMLEQAGFRVVHVWNKDVNEDLEGVLDTIRSHLGGGGA